MIALCCDSVYDLQATFIYGSNGLRWTTTTTTTTTVVTTTCYCLCPGCSDAENIDPKLLLVPARWARCCPRASWGVRVPSREQGGRYDTVKVGQC